MWLFFIIISMSSTDMSAQLKEYEPGENVLHGVFRPEGHASRTFTFYSNGEFTCEDAPSSLERRRFGRGTYAIGKKELVLTFLEALRAPTADLIVPEEPHVETIRFRRTDGEQGWRIIEFELKTGRGKPQWRPWSRGDEVVPKRELPSSVREAPQE
ncbi:MAG: hypothetical protein AAGN35_14125 [Bacteroidota bacterium]